MPAEVTCPRPPPRRASPERFGGSHPLPTAPSKVAAPAELPSPGARAPRAAEGPKGGTTTAGPWPQKAKLRSNDWFLDDVTLIRDRGGILIRCAACLYARQPRSELLSPDVSCLGPQAMCVMGVRTGLGFLNKTSRRFIALLFAKSSPLNAVIFPQHCWLGRVTCSRIFGPSIS